MKGQLLFLGTGASMGVPVVGCQCEVCLSTLSHNKRLRPSALLSIDGKKILIDCGPDFREQALRISLDRVDGIMISHAHHDHTAGMDDLRPLYMKGWERIPLLLSEDTLRDVQSRFHYLFDANKQIAGKPAFCFDAQLLDGERGHTQFLGIPVRYFTYEQMGMKVTGFRIGNLAYVSDIKKYPETIFEDLAGVETLIISALRYTVSPMHLNIDDAIDFVDRSGVKKGVLMHISHELEHEKANAYLPESIRLAYDGLILEY